MTTEKLDESIKQLSDASRGHSNQTQAYIGNAINYKISQGKIPTLPQIKHRFTAAFDIRDNGLKNLGELCKYQVPPTRLYIPLAVGDNHMVSLIIDINKDGLSEILYFNSFGKSNNNGIYHQEAEQFIDVINHYFPLKIGVTNPHFHQKKVHYVQQCFQREEARYCGDWVQWHLQEAVKMPSAPLEAILDHFESLKVSDYPHHESLRKKHIKILEDYRPIEQEINRKRLKLDFDKRLERQRVVATAARAFARSARGAEASSVLPSSSITSSAPPKFTPVTAGAAQQGISEEARGAEQEDAGYARTVHIERTLSNITKILTELNEKIGGIDKHQWQKAKEIATTLLATLESAKKAYRDNLWKNNPEAGQVFKAACEQAIMIDAMPILKKDLGWGLYLWNLFKKLVSTIIPTLGQDNHFWARTTPTSELAVQDAFKKLTELQTGEEARKTSEEERNKL